MLPIPPASFAPIPTLPVEETPAPPVAAPEAAADGTSTDGADLFGVLKNMFGLHPDLTGAAPDPGRVAQAKREYDQALALFDTGRYADALEHFERAQALVPAAANLFSQGACLERLGRHEQAAQRYEAYAAAAPSAGDAGQAKAHAAELHATARNLARDAYDRGTAALNGGRFEEAATAFRAARDHLPSSAATYMLAKSLDLAGASVATVVREYQRYLDQAPGAGDAGAVRDRIHALLAATGNGLMEPR